MKRRLDQFLFDTGLCSSREKAKRTVLAGTVRINGRRAPKPSDPVSDADRVELISAPRYVSRGGQKLEGALHRFDLDAGGLTVVDLGASTGGFTDCLLQHGAARVLAVDVGQGQLAWKLRQDPRVVVREKVNARYLTRAQLPATCSRLDLAVIDCSFISLTLILPVAADLLDPGKRILALIKPQFEAGKRETGKGRGVIRDPEIHRRIVARMEQFVVEELGHRWQGHCESPIAGPAGNLEFFCLIEKTHAQDSSNRSDCQRSQTGLER